MERAPADRSAVFPLFELLEVAPGVFDGSLLPALEPRHQAALALTCTQLRDAVQQSVTTLTLRAGSCCMSRQHLLGEHMPNVRRAVLKPGNLHEAMFVLPLFFLQGARFMNSLTSLQLHDLLPDRPPEEIQCSSCTAWASTYDMSAILASAGHCIPHLASLDFSTHYVSDAECAAIALMTGLTHLQLCSVHGTHIGGLSRLSSLPSLRSLSLSDHNYSSRPKHHDLAMLLCATSLTRLAMAPHNLTGPLLNCLSEMHEPNWQAEMAEAPPPPPPQQGASPAAAAAAGAAGGAAGVRAALAAHNMADAGAAAFSPGGEGPLPAPPPLLWLRVALNPGPRFEGALVSACSLTRLTRLELGWTHVPHDHRPLDMTPNWPEAAQQQLGNLTSLRELALGWTPTPGVLAALARNSALTCLHLGGLFSALPGPPAVGRLRLPNITRLAAHMETPPHVLAAAAIPTDPEPLAHNQCVAALEAFPSLTRLELTGRMYGPALAELPEVLPADKLRELLLPQRLAATNAQLAGLRRLHGLTSLRLGWRSVYHAGPAGYAAAAFDPQQQGEWPLSLASLVGLADGALPGRPAAVTQSQGGPVASSAGAGSAAAAAGSSSSRVAGSSSCRLCYVPLARGCWCRGLRRLEVVGPLAPGELRHLGSLPAIRQLVLRDNPSWSSGLPPGALAVTMTQLTQLECYRCPGVDGHHLEMAAARIAPALGAEPHGCRVVIVPRGGVSAAELGRGHQHMGVTLLACEELGLMPDEVAGDTYTSEQLAPEPEPPKQPQDEGAHVLPPQHLFGHPFPGMPGFGAGHALHFPPHLPLPQILHHPPPPVPPWGQPHFAHPPPPPQPPPLPPPPPQGVFQQFMGHLQGAGIQIQGGPGGIHVQGGGIHMQGGPGGVHVQVGHGQGPQGVAHQMMIIPQGGVMMINAQGGAAGAAGGAGQQGGAGPAHAGQPAGPHGNFQGGVVQQQLQDDSDEDEDDVA